MEHSLPWWRWLLLLLLFATLVGAWYGLNRDKLNPRNWLAPSTSLIRVLERRWLGSKSYISLVEVNGQRFLLAQTPQGVAWQKIDSPLSHETPRT